MPAKTPAIKFKLNGKSVTAWPGETVLVAARRLGVEIPALCYHPDFPAKGNCRVCVVEVAGRGKLQTACSTPVEDGMEIRTDSPRAIESRNTNLELIYAEHIEKCPTCIWRFECPLLEYAKKYQLKMTRFADRKRKRTTYRFANAVEIDGTQCIDCRNCVDACSLLQKIDHLEIAGKGAGQEIRPVDDGRHECILCGQCALHCPVSSAQESGDWQTVEELLENKAEDGSVLVAQFAPSVRVTVGEDFGLENGQVWTDNVVAGLKALGFDYVFDVSLSADVTTLVEAEELLERLGGQGALPMFTSCCPGWVNYAEIYHPELIPNLTTARSPHIHGGGYTKTYWADKQGVDPKKIIVVSIMPCTAKKYEAVRPEMRIGGLQAVDHVLTTREFTFLMKKHKIDFPKLKKVPIDDPLADYSGAGVIFGGTGGVMESALRTAHFMTCGRKETGICRQKVEFSDVRGLADVKEAVVEIAGKTLRVAVVNGIGNIEGVIARLKDFDYIEVMACPGGCIGGGGQPIPTTPEIRAKRIAALYSDDQKKQVRKSFENPIAVEIVEWLKAKGLKDQVLCTNFKKRTKY